MKKEDLKVFREKMTACAKEMGIDLEIGTITFGANSFSFSAKGYEGEAGKKEEFTRVAIKKGFSPSLFGKEFKKFVKDETVTFRVVGAKPRARKYPLVIMNVETGDEHVCAVSYTNSSIM